MGAWGAKLYQDDVAQDVKEQYKESLKKGKSNEEATQQVLDEYRPMLNDIDDGPVFWFALAETQWSLGRLLPEVKEQALACIDKGTDQARWERENPKKAPERKKILEDLRIKLNSPMPPMKKISQPKNYKCEWKIGDVYSFKLESDLASEKGVYGRYILFQKIGEMAYYPEHIIPVVWVKITNGDVLPSNEKEYLDLEYVKLAKVSLIRLFGPIDKNRSIEEQFFEKAGRRFDVDESGRLDEYRIYLINTSKRIIPKKLIFLGNFSVENPPKNDYEQSGDFCYRGYLWKFLESNMIDSYLTFNTFNDENKST